MENFAREVENWFKERPIWLQDAACRLIKKGEFDDADYDDLLKLCSVQIGVESDVHEIPNAQTISSGSFSQVETFHKVKISSISNVVGVNALNPQKPLTVADGLTVIYGQNSSGKSGYVRLLKQICGAKKSGLLHPNTYSEHPEKQSCTIKFIYDGNKSKLDWKIEQGICEQLSAVEIYDSECGSVYMIDENQLAYEPTLLRLFSQLTDAADEISNRLDELSEKLVSKIPQLPSEYHETKSGRWYKSISFATTKKSIDGACDWSDKDRERLDSLKTRLNTLDPKASSTALRKNKEAIDWLLSEFRKWQSKLRGEATMSYLSKKKDFSDKQVAASKYAKSIFENSPLAGIGDEAWNLLWEQARAYSEIIAYPHKGYPYVEDDAVCVLCQQPLNETAKKRLLDFESFVKGELESASKKAKAKLDEIEASLKNIPHEKVITGFMVGANLDDGLCTKLTRLRKKIAQQSQRLLDSNIDEGFNSNINFEVLNELDSLSVNVEAKAKQFDEDAKEDKRQEIKIEAIELEAKKWLSQQECAISSEVNMLNKKEQILEAKKLTNTMALTKKKTYLLDKLVTTEYINRFKATIKNLGADGINVKLQKTRSDKGKVYFQIKLDGNRLGMPIDNILSEGEFRIVSLAAFLADVEGHAGKSSFVFDDPISSLDQNYEENVCSCLAEMATERQVIVFTHRLSMLSLLEDVSKKVGNSCNVICLRKQPWGAGEPSETPIFAQRPTRALNSLLSRANSAKKTFNYEGWEDYEILGKGITSEMRIVLEKIVEKDLLADVVSRFRRDIHTKNKLNKVSKITPEDCNFIDEFMTKYSKFEHSQSEELPVSLPEPNELIEDIETIKLWLDNFNKREV